MPAPGPTSLTLLVLLPLIGWRLYARIRRTIGRQRLSRVRPWITLTIFPALLLLLVSLGREEPLTVAWLGAGLAAGGALALYGLRKTRFEPTPQGLYYTPNAHLGIALSLLFAGRIAYRLVELYTLGPLAPLAGAGLARSSLTLAIFGLLAGYYVGYAIGLVRWRVRVESGLPAVTAPGTSSARSRRR